MIETAAAVALGLVMGVVVLFLVYWVGVVLLAWYVEGKGL